jgi:lysophospholipid acyltransferase (LPLAT)-like uncharacterized protein
LKAEILKSEPPRSKRKATGVIIPHKPRWYQRLAAWWVVSFLRCVALTVRFRLNDQSGVFTQPGRGPTIYCFWHNRLALCVAVYHRYVRFSNKTEGMAALVSASKDGAFLSAILDAFDILAVRGSSSRRGSQALLELTGCAEDGFDLAITPDGPRGPCYSVQEGVMSLAQLTGLPVIPASSNLNWKVQVNSWDRFQIPLPFARCDVNVGKPIRVPRECSDEQREALRQELERTLRELSTD